MATVIASQALITGVYSITMQAIQLQYLPRMKIDHTSHKEFGQIYVANMNWALMVCCIALVISFGSSTSLAAAYGIAVTMTMLITTVLFYFVARFSWNWSNYVAIPLCGFFAGVELCYFGANALKILHGGWFPLVVGALVFTIMSTWNRGRKILSERMLEKVTPIPEVMAKLMGQRIHRNPGVAVYMAGQPKFAPSTLTLNLHHYSSLHEIILIVTVKTDESPYVDENKRAIVKNMTQGFYKVELTYGFMEVPDVPRALSKIKLRDDQSINMSVVTYFLGQEHLLAKANGNGMALWRERLFAYMARNSQSASRFFNLPADQVITVGLMVEL
jgi:KUP system potassium uptake protein